MTIEELEAGPRLLDRGDIDEVTFWQENLAAFRQTVLLAIRETSDALMAQQVPGGWRTELEGQVEVLRWYLELADRHEADRVSSPRFDS